MVPFRRLKKKRIGPESHRASLNGRSVVLLSASVVYTLGAEVCSGVILVSP